MPWEELNYRAGVYLHNHPEVQPVASFNAGIIGFFADNKVINVDGLVNDSIYAYSSKGKLAVYFAKRNIKFVVDFPGVFEDPMPRRGGMEMENCNTVSNRRSISFPTIRITTLV